MKTKIFIIPLLLISFAFAYFTTVRADEACGGSPDGMACLLGGKNGVCKSDICDTTGGVSPNPNPNSGQIIEFTNPLGFNTVEGFFGSVLGTLRGIIVILSLVFIVLGGVMYIVSAGNEKMMTTAKGAITAAMIGLAIGIAAPSFLKEISNILGWSGGSGITGLTMSEIAMNFLNFLLAIVGILALIMLIVGGIMYLTSAGDEDRVKTGKKIVTYAIIGITVALASMVIVRQIANLLK